MRLRSEDEIKWAKERLYEWVSKIGEDYPVDISGPHNRLDIISDALHELRLWRRVGNESELREEFDRLIE